MISFYHYRISRYKAISEGVGSICQGYMCIVLYINLCGVMVFQTSMLDYRRGWGQYAMGICALCYIYMKLIWCHSFPDIYARLEGVHLPSVYMCILLYVKLIWCNGLTCTYGQLTRGVHLPSV